MGLAVACGAAGVKVDVAIGVAAGVDVPTWAAPAGGVAVGVDVPKGVEVGGGVGVEVATGVTVGGGVGVEVATGVAVGTGTTGGVGVATGVTTGVDVESGITKGVAVAIGAGTGDAMGVEVASGNAARSMGGPFRWMTALSPTLMRPIPSVLLTPYVNYGRTRNVHQHIAELSTDREGRAVYRDDPSRQRSSGELSGRRWRDLT